ncbi:hypothetical protein NLX86_30655 [Streptomyces sp. A3M-1-3]|nr:hypothetical protein [Streptomyces sp. A3M-1-3]MCP3822287.1 hypothetical protein [Streptomyces sp. A3M-1-3]
MPRAAFDMETAELALVDTARARLIPELPRLGLRPKTPIDTCQLLTAREK